MESTQDHLDPMNDNILIIEEPQTGDVTCISVGAIQVGVRDQQSFLESLILGEALWIAANTKLNTESSRGMHCFLRSNDLLGCLPPGAS